ncbi:MAG: M81 family peptidase, partial [Planctomycetia bacterium]|nr:M81 family peptidase [Planctomycetia bacterium]
ASTECEVGGFFAELADQGVEAVPVFAARATPYGIVTADAWHNLMNRLDQEIHRAGPLDGWLVAPHGAMVSEPEPDADGAWLARLRRHVGPVPIVGTLDLHANLSARMVAACDALIGYRTNPHLDQKARGREAASLLVRTLRGEVWPKMAAAFPPVVINIERQHTDSSPCRTLFAAADNALRQSGVLSDSILLGFPYADVPEMGAAAIAVTDGNDALAQQVANQLGSTIWQHREELVGQLISIDDAVRTTATAAAPVGLLDMGDNVGGGSPGDSTSLVHALLAQGVRPCFVCLYAPQVVRAAGTAGVGGRFRARVGTPPLEAEFTVRGLADGRYTDSQVRHGGQTTYDQGATAVIETDTGLTIMATTRRAGPWSIRQLTAFGVDPATFRAIVIKGVHAPFAAYAPVCPTLIRVDTPGTTTANLDALTFLRRRRPLFPFERTFPETEPNPSRKP